MPDSASGRLPTMIAALGLAAAIALAGYGAATDSLTVDEPSHLVAGYGALALEDFRLSPDHPPLARMLLALPLAGGGTAWRPPAAETAATAKAWRSGDFFTLGRDFMESWNDGQQRARASRWVAIALLALLLATIWLAARRFFGAAGGAVALWVAAFDPTLLAHGHLATIDVPFTLAALATLLAADAWLARPAPWRLALVAALFAAAALTKFSFFPLVPALLAMALAAGRGRPGRETWRLVALGGAALAAVTLVAIWAAYGFRFAAARGEDAGVATMHVLGDQGRARPTTPAGAWEVVLHDPATGQDRRGIAAPLLRFARDHRLLPEAYLYGAAYVAKKGMTRASYLRGDYSTEGFASYFPWAFAIKMPLPAIALMALGLGTLALGAWRRRRLGQPPLTPFAWGGLIFAAVYLAALLSSALNLGIRHLLPVIALLAIASGAAWNWRDPAAVGDRLLLDEDSEEEAPLYNRIDVLILLAWLTFGTVWASPWLIGYFNESVGWRRGHQYLADSNLDWGQDLLRLEERLRRDGPDGPVWLVQAGDPPLPRGLAAMGPRWIFGEGSHSPHPERIGGGLYVISATELLGVYRPLARAETWRNSQWIERYEQLADQAASGRRDPAAVQPDAYEAMRRLRLISRLAQRPPDERVGTSLFLFRLSDSQVAEMTAP